MHGGRAIQVIGCAAYARSAEFWRYGANHGAIWRDLARNVIPAFVMLLVGALLACTPSEPSSAHESARKLPGGVALDGGMGGAVRTERARRPSPLLASAPTSSPPPEIEAPNLPPVTNHEPAIAPRAPGYECRVPIVAIPKASGCRAGGAYPRCRWQLPLPKRTGGLYAMWRNTTEDRWWGRPGLVGILLAAAREFQRLHPEQVLDIGDLDAAGPRHATHDRGVDVDIYLRGAMVTENEGAGAQPWNYWDQDPRLIEDLRWRVEELARILATCTEGKLRIYYNDPVVEQRFHAWFREQGYRSPFGAPMQPHNELHQFHFHVTIADDTEVPPKLRTRPTTRDRERGSELAALSRRP